MIGVVTVAAGLSPLRVWACLLALGVLALSGWVAYGRAAHPVPPETPEARELRLATIQLEAAGSTLEQAHDLIGTYEQTDLRIFQRLLLVRATESHFCIQVVGREGGLYHLAGPGGAVAQGSC